MVTRGESIVASEAVLRGLRGKRIDVKSWAFQAALVLALLLSLAVLVVLLTEIARSGLEVLQDRGGDFLSKPLFPLASEAGVSQGLLGSALIVMFVMLLAFPIGVGAAVYLEEYARNTRFTRFVNVNIRNLAGVPAIVYGLLGLAVFVTALADVTGGPTIISGGLTLAVLTLPIVIITTSEALRAVPKEIREAGYGVGATKWEVIRSHVLPSAAPGILTGTVLSLSRAVGETAPLLLVGAITGFFASGAQGPLEQLRGPYTTLPTIIFSWARQPSADFRALTSAAIIVLMVLILTANAAAIFLRNRYDRKW